MKAELSRVECGYRRVLMWSLLSSSDPADAPCEGSSCACGSRGKLLLHCFLQGLKAGLSEGTGESSHAKA